MKLIDRLLADGKVAVAGTEGESLGVQPPSAVVLADAVVGLAGTTTDYGPLRCPMEGLWIEVNTGPPPHQIGALLTEKSAQPADWPDHVDVSGRREILVRALFGMRGLSPIASPYGYSLLVDAQGTMHGSSMWSAWECVPHPDEQEWNTALSTRGLLSPQSATIYSTCLTAHLMAHAIGFMNVKNVRLEPHEPPMKLSRAHQRRTGGPPLVKWSTIRLPAPAGTPSASGASGEMELPLHLVRGHFKTYTQARPLFGRRTGTYWWPAALRGDAERGERLHEYKLTEASDHA